MSSDNEYSDQEYYDDEDEDILLDDAEDGELVLCSVQCARAYKATESASEMDVDVFDTDFKVPGKGRRKVYEIEYDPLSQAAIEKMMRDDVGHISGIFGIDVSSGRLSNSYSRFITHHNTG